MAPNNRSFDHRIRRLVFDLDCPDEATAFDVRQRLAGLANDTVIPVLEEAFDAYAPSDRLIHLDRLELDLGRIAGRDFDQAAIRQAIAYRIAAQLAGRWQAAQATEGAVPPSHSLVDALVAYLETGVWPWYAPYRTLAAAEAALRALAPDQARRAAERLLSALRPSAPRRRLLYQFNVGLAEWLVRRAYGEAAEALISAGQTVEDPLQRAAGERTAQEFAAALLAVVSAAPPGRSIPPSEAQRLWAAAFAFRATPPTDAPESASSPPPGHRDEAVEPAATPGRTQVETAGEGLYVELAGVVLLHPFLPRFYANVGLLDERGQFVSFEARVRGVHLLYALATGQECPAEPATILLKLLCGLPIAVPLPRELPLTDEERGEVESLLQAVIGHWGKLGSVSAAGLRETFLQREGKLMRLEQGWRLAVEQRSVDILLGHLPWGLSVVRLPWMGDPLHVDWA